jgi:hypothetical protein
MAAIVFPSAEKILTGDSLVPLLPRYHVLFDECLSKLQTEVGSAIYDLNQGTTSLQQAIENKNTYRKQTRIPAWVYSIFDWMGWGAVARAEKELHRVILEVFNQALNSPVLKVQIPAFIEPLKACYLEKYRDHALFKEISKIERVQEILCEKGIEKPDFLGMLSNLDAERQNIFKRQLLWVLGSKFDKLAELQYESEPGLKLNLFQLTLKYRQLALSEWMIDEILPKCSEGVQKSLLTQKGKKTEGTHNAVHILAECLSSEIIFPSIEWNKPIKIGQIRKKHDLLGKLIALFNQVSYPKGATDLSDVLVYCHGYRRNWPIPENREVFLKAMNA